MRNLTKTLCVLALLLMAVPALADGPWLVVASASDSNVTVLDMNTMAPVEQRPIGSQTIGVATLGRTIVVSDFLGGKLDIFKAQKVGAFFGFTLGKVVTAPDLLNPEGIVPTGDPGWVLVSDGGKQAEGPDVGLVLADVIHDVVLDVLPLPSVYAVAYHPQTRMAWVLDGFGMKVIGVRLSPVGELLDTGIRIPLTGTAFGPRYIAVDHLGTRAFVTHKFDGAVEVLDLAGQTSMGFVQGLGAGIGAFAITPDGTRALVANYNESLFAVLDLTTPMPTDTGLRIPCNFGVPNTYVGTKTFAFEGDWMYYSCTNSNVVHAVNWKTYEMHPLWGPVGAAPAGLAIVR